LLLQDLSPYTALAPNASPGQDSQLITSGSDDKTIRVWDADTGKAHIGRIWSVARKRIVSGSDDTILRVWDAETGDALGAPLRGHSRQIWSVAVSPDGRHIVSSSEDETIWMWDAYTGEALGDPLRGHFGPCRYFAEWKSIVSGDDMFRVRDAETGKALNIPLRTNRDDVLSVAISANGQHIVSGSSRCGTRNSSTHTNPPMYLRYIFHPTRLMHFPVPPQPLSL
jgi:WD40 repeat protein